jgi:hypothetical protein
MSNPYQSSAIPGGGPMLILAAVGAALASLYWGGMTLLLLLGAITGSTSALQLVLPALLIGLYALRAVQMLRGDVSAANRIVLLHVFGGFMAALSMISGGGLLIVLQSIKLAIHVFGGVTAFLASR